MRIVDTFGLPEAVVNAIRNDQYDRGEPLPGTAGIYSPSSMMQPPQLSALFREHTDDIEIEAVTRFWALLGSGVHYTLELAAEQVGQEYAEERLFARFTVDGTEYTISGMVDNRTTTAINDYKVTSSWTILNGGRDEWNWQQNIYAWLCRKNGKQVTNLTIYAMLRDWSWRRALESDKYPQTPIVTWPIKLYSDGVIEAYMMGRIRMHEAAKAGDVDECADEDRWYKGSTWAIRKAGMKRAVKVEDNLQAITNYAVDKGLTVLDAGKQAAFGVKETDLDDGFEKGEHYLVERIGENIRCARYCPVVQYCEQAKILGVTPTERAYGRT